jgi:hypothetical protein
MKPIRGPNQADWKLIHDEMIDTGSDGNYMFNLTVSLLISVWTAHVYANAAFSAADDTNELQMTLDGSCS